MGPEPMRMSAVAVSLVCAATARASERSADLVNSFQSFCIPTPDFGALEIKAAAMKLPVRKDSVAPPKAGESGHVKSWVVSLASGQHELVASQARSPKGDLDSCGIGVEDVDGEDLRQEAVKALNLGTPLRQTWSADGAQRVTTWKYSDDELFLGDASSVKIPGAYLTLLHQIKNR
jgi:hypothetical protein